MHRQNPPFDSDTRPSAYTFIFQSSLLASIFTRMLLLVIIVTSTLGWWHTLQEKKGTERGHPEASTTTSMGLFSLASVLSASHLLVVEPNQWIGQDVAVVDLPPTSQHLMMFSSASAIRRGGRRTPRLPLCGSACLTEFVVDPVVSDPVEHRILQWFSL